MRANIVVLSGIQIANQIHILHMIIMLTHGQLTILTISSSARIKKIYEISDRKSMEKN